MAHDGADAPVEFFFAILEGDDQDDASLPDPLSGQRSADR